MKTTKAIKINAANADAIENAVENAIEDTFFSASGNAEQIVQIAKNTDGYLYDLLSENSKLMSGATFLVSTQITDYQRLGQCLEPVFVQITIECFDLGDWRLIGVKQINRCDYGNSVRTLTEAQSTYLSSMKSKYMESIKSVVAELGSSDESMRPDCGFVNRVSAEAYNRYGLNAARRKLEYDALIEALDEYFK